VEQDPPGLDEADELFDRELTRVLATLGPMLEEKSQALLDTGTASIARPDVLLQARLRVSRWRRRGWLEVTAEDPVSGAMTSGFATVVGWAGRNQAQLIKEISVHLALELTYGVPGAPGAGQRPGAPDAPGAGQRPG
jgi:hypothetical protein